MSKDAQKTDLTRLKAVIDAYGACENRWPESERRDLAVLLAQNPEARRLHAEAWSLDQVLTSLPKPKARDGLRNDIMVYIRSSQDLETTTSGSQVIQFPKERGVRNRGKLNGPLTQWWAASALAASFVLGVFLGASGTTGTSLDSILGLMRLPGAEIAMDAGNDDTDGLFEEDIL